MSICAAAPVLLAIVAYRASGLVLWRTNGYQGYPSRLLPILATGLVFQTHDRPHRTDAAGCLRTLQADRAPAEETDQASWSGRPAAR